MLVFFAMLANADDWVEMEVFGKKREKLLRNYLELPVYVKGIRGIL